MYILIVMNVKLIQLYDEVIFIVQSLIYEHVSMILYRFIISLVFVLFAKKGDVIYIFYFFSLFYDRHKIILFKKNQEKNASHLLFSNSILLFKLIQHDLVDRNTIFCEFSELFHAIVQSLVILFFILRRKKWYWDFFNVFLTVIHRYEKVNMRIILWDVLETFSKTLFLLVFTEKNVSFICW